MDLKANLEVGYGLARGEDAFAVGREAAQKALIEIKEYPISVVQVFASARYDLEELLKGIREVLGETPLVGATTAGEICNGVEQETVVVMALASPHLRVRVGVGQGVSRDWQGALIEAITASQIAPYFCAPESAIWSMLTHQGKSAFALLFSPGPSLNSESYSFDILEVLNRLSQGRLPIMGAGAADGCGVEGSSVFWGSQVYPDSILVAIFETSLKFGISVAHGFRPTAQRAMVTLAEGREVLELDGRPAAEVYGQMHGLPREALEGKHLTFTTGRPLGIADPYGQYSINVATHFTPDGGVTFTQPVPEGTTLTLMAAEPDSLAAAGAEALHKALLRGSIREPGVVLVFSSALRRQILGDRLGEEISGLRQMAPQAPVLGFYSFGEQGLGDDGVNRHNSEVIVLLALGRELSYAAEVALENDLLRLSLENQGAIIKINERLELEVAEREQTEEKLRKSEELFQSFMQHLPGAAVIVDAKGRYIYVNETWERMTQRTREEILGKTAADIWPPDIATQFREADQLAFATKQVQQTVVQHSQGDEVHSWLMNRFPILDQDGSPFLVGVVGIDITERQQLEASLRESEATLRSIFKAAPIGIGLVNNRTMVWVNEQFTKMTEYTAAELVGQSTRILYDSDEEFERMGRKDEEMRQRRGRSMSETRWQSKDGRVLDIIASSSPVDPADPNADVIFTAMDITEFKQAEEAFKSLVYSAPIGIFIAQGGKFKLVNPGFLQLTGYEENEMLGQDALCFVPLEFQENVRSQAIQMLKGERAAPFEFQILTKGDELRWVVETVTSIQYEGKRATLGFFMDIHERAMLENQLLQAQKMEAVGRLAGGVAHDFNNMLTAIMGYCEIVMMSFREEDPIFLHLEGIRKSADRAATLTRQLLAFSRKQLLQPRVTNLNTVITDLEKMLRRLIGEDIDLIINLDPELLPVKADPGQIEQVIMNLVINARDAMPLGGELVIQTDNVYLDEAYTRHQVDLLPGPYTKVSVIDHGLGMAPETLAHVFEPFFTTKEAGKGTGLGLSTVYGIVKQSGGHIEVFSRLGGGTTFEIYLRQLEEAVEESPVKAVLSAPSQGWETVLVVEDEEILLDLIKDALEMHGYQVLTARNGREALEMCDRHTEPIHLMLTDVVMPHQNGRELAEYLAPRHPEMKILYMSGYTEDAMVVRGLVEAALPFIQKPFPPMDLVRKVREMIDSPRN